MKVTVIDHPPGANEGRPSKPAPQMGFDPLRVKCKLKDCATVIQAGDIVCGLHAEYRCPYTVPKGSNHIDERRCRNTTTPGEPCWRHR